MIKTEKRSRVQSIRTESTETEIALIKRDIEVIRDNHLHHLKEDVERVERKVDRIDTRLWMIAGIIIAATVGPLIGNLFL